MILIMCLIVPLFIGTAIFLAFGTYETKREVKWNKEQEERKKEEEEKNNVKKQFFRNELFKNFDLKDDQKEIIGDELNGFNTKFINNIVLQFNKYSVLYPEKTQSEKMKNLIESIERE